MNERISAEELARLSDADVVRRELDRANRRTLAVQLVLFAVLGAVLLLIDAISGPVPGGPASMVAANIAINLAAAAALRRVRRGMTVWVLLFCVLQFAVILSQTGGWIFTALLALLFSRFRLEFSQTLGLYALLTAGMLFMAWRQPLPPIEQFAPGQITMGAVVISLLIIGNAAALQIVSTNRVRNEIAEEWREPLQNAREQVRMRDELRFARETQLSMLPESPPKLDWLELAAVSIPAAEVGGDYYDFFVDGDRVAVVACDVAGHGMQSGLVLASMRGGLIAMLRRSMAGPADVLDQLHELVAQTSRRRMLAAAVMVVFDRKTRRATLASAAHPPVMLRRGTHVEILEAFAPPLGVKLPFASGERAIELQPGDVVVIHSDGVYESRNTAGEEYGLERLQAFLAAQPADANADQLRDAIVRDVERFRGRAQDDDVTVVVARVMPHGTIGGAWI